MEKRDHDASLETVNKDRHLKLFINAPHRCSYLPDRQARTLFIDPAHPVTPALYEQLSLLGFRRSGTNYYRPQCEACNACIPARIPVNRFQPNRTQRRISKKNRDLSTHAVEPAYCDEHYELFARYIRHQHSEGDMFPPSVTQYKSFLIDGSDQATFYEFRKEEKLVAVAVVDELNTGLSAIYTFYDPDLRSRSLGTFAILWEVEQARAQNKPFLYLGYWIKNCRQMAYKAAFQPLEIQIGKHWMTAPGRKHVHIDRN